jgi:thiol-disulfide isomerase/thioredoxin
MATEQQTKPVKIWQKNWVQNLLWVVAFIAIYLTVRPFMQGDVIQGEAPIMQVTSITGKEIDLQQLTQQDEPVLVHIWATWCPICEVSKGGVESIAEDYKVINIATQSADSEQLLEYARQNQMNPDIIVNDLEGKWMKTFGSKAVPADFIISPDGRIEYVEVGFTTSIGLRIRLWLASL